MSGLTVDDIIAIERDKDAELTKLRAEVEALRDKASRFRGWAVRYTSHSEHLPEGPPERSDVVTSAEARRYAKYARRAGWTCHVVRVYRRAVPR